MNKKKMYL